MMEVNLVGWITIVFFLFVTTFGLQACINIVLACIAFIAGVLTMLYLASDKETTNVTTQDLLDNPLDQSSYTSSLVQVMRIFNEPKKVTKTDKRITGSESVDTFLHEIFGYLMKDYVTPWYSIITSDKEFEERIRQTAQSVAVNLSNRIKTVNWLNYFMGRPVEDLTGHLRLFRGAGGGLLGAAAPSPSRPPRRGSPARSPPNNSPQQQHRRNKSDTDVASYAGKQRNVANSRFYVETNNTKHLSFEQQFFKLEREMEKNLISREKMCTDLDTETSFIAEICQLLFYISLEADDFKGGASLAIMRVISCVTLQSALSYITDPDTLNTLVLRFICYDGLSSESFLSVIRSSDNVDELKCTLDLVLQEIQNLVSHDTVGECDIAVKQQLSSLQYLVRMLNTRSSALTPSESSQQRQAVTQLPMNFLLENHLALGYFLDYAQSMGAHEYIFCHLQIQAWRAAAVKHLATQVSGIHNVREGTVSEIKSAAQAIYDQYLAGGILNSGDVPHTLVRNLITNLGMPLDEKSIVWFQEVEDFILTKLTIVGAGFKNSRQYTMLLAELDLENFNSSELTKFGERNDNGSQNYGSKTSLSSLSDSRLSDNSETDVERISGSSKFFIDSLPNSRSQSPGPTKSTEQIPTESGKEAKAESSSSLQIQDPRKQIQQWIFRKESCLLEADIYETGVVHERGKAFGVYAVKVTRRCPSTGQQFCWHVYRRYSDFLDLYNSIKDQYPELGKMEFPSKKTFHNTSRSVLERRKEVLSIWLSALAALGSPNGPPRYVILHSSLLLPFLSPKDVHDKQNQRVIDTMLVQPIRQGMRTLRGVPGQLFSTVDDLMEGLSKVLSNSKSESTVVLPSLQERSDVGTELPLRVLLLLLDEVFELRKRNQWLRRQISALLRQLLTVMFSHVLNKRIIECISSLTSPGTIVQCLDIVKRTYWSEGNGIPRRTYPRDAAERARARVAVKAALLAVCQEELKHIIGSETTHRGLMTVFELFQNPVLNKRLLYLFVEGLIGALYPDMDVKGVFRKLLRTAHSSKMAHLQVN